MSGHDTFLGARPGAVLDANTPAKRLHPLAMITILTLIFPLNFTLGTLFMTPSRTLFLFTVPYLMIRWAKGDFNGRLMVDWLVLFYVLWMMVTIIFHHPSKALTFVGTTSLIILGGYMTGRATIRTNADFQALTRFLTGVVMVFAPLALIESITHHAFILNFLNKIPGFSSYTDVDYCCRLGLDRAQVVFVHPIHYGMFASLPFALYFFGLRNQITLPRRVIGSLVLGFACFLSISSGPFLSMLSQGAISSYGMVTDKNRSNWKTLLICLAVAYAIIEVSSTHVGIFAIASKLSFNSSTAYVRSILFEYGVQQIWRTPLLGNGYNQVPMPPFMTGSIDNFWLLLAVVHGLPAFFACFFAFIYSMIRAGRGQFIRGSDLYNARVAWTALLISLTLTLATVAIWSEAHSAVMMMLGAGQFLLFVSEPAAGMVPQSVSRRGPQEGWLVPASPVPASAHRIGSLPYSRAHLRKSKT